MNVSETLWKCGEHSLADECAWNSLEVWRGFFSWWMWLKLFGSMASIF